MDEDQLPPTGHLTVPFDAGEPGRAELTWSQRALWELHRRLRPNHHYFNFGRLFDVPAGVRLADVTAAVRHLVERYEAFRTTVRCTEPDQPHQHIAGRGEYWLAQYDTAVGTEAAVAEQLSYEYQGYPFADDEWPLKVGVVTGAGIPRYVLFMASHLAVDRWGMEQASAAFSPLLADPAKALPPAGTQPRDQAAAEGSPAGARLARRAAEFWRRTLSTVPQTMFPAPATAPEARWCPQGRLSSRALALAAGHLGARHGASAAGVILAAMAALLGRRTGNERVVLRLFAANRYGREARELVGTCVQTGLFTVDTGPGDFGDLVDRAWAATVLAYRHSRYPPVLIEETVAAVNVERGIDLDLLYHFHDATAVTGPAGAAGDPVAALAESRYRRGGSLGRHQKVLVDLGGSAGTQLHLALTADPGYLSASDVEGLVRGVETLVVQAAIRPVRLSELPGLTGLTAPGPSPTAVVVDHCRIEPDAVRDLLCAVPGVRAARVEVGRDADGRVELVGRVASDREDLEVDVLHWACLARLPGRPTAMTPTRYIIHRADLAGPERYRGTGRPD